ncbi:tRNA N6-adenosine threonylcarbamoyltransferase, mitochondrial [Cladophialophora carrionii]|uniref:N(6)-L-threonylcarbamoyladenine synthase n=1 Tax=Cladophialophora carrionii TaxID=86049 RepID=A0A1C1CJS4_9EURO|nr:tRNA N6-adenosine threonylcarbamoyltransferase, mitochondrial [Cladophialophora carrionii]
MLHACRSIKTLPSRCWHAFSTSARRRNLLTLAIETSCDDTCVSILSTTNRHNGVWADLLFNEKVTAKNTGKGGILPTESLESHQSNLSTLLESALPYLPNAPDTVGPRTVWLGDGSPVQKPDFISVTRGPGMSASLGVGLATAKGLATAWQIPMVGVHHMQAHALTPRLVSAMGKDGHDHHGHSPNFPFLTLLVSGGHTMLLHSKGLLDHEILATTTDTAIGDELDKCGRLILPKELQAGTPDTAFGKYLSAYAFRTPEDFASWRVPATRAEEIDKPVNEFGWGLSTPKAQNRELAFSFSGIASQVKRLILARGIAGGMTEMERLLLARSALGAAFEHLGSRTIIALEKLRAEGIQIDHLVVSGGVAANTFLRYYLRELLDRRAFGRTQLVFPPVEFCTDNAAMIAWAGTEMFEAGYSTELGCAPVRKWSMDSHQPGGGILGIEGWIRTGTQ